MLAIILIILSPILGWFGIEWITESLGLINISPDISLQEWYSIFRLYLFIPNLLITILFLFIVFILDRRTWRNFSRNYKIVFLIFLVIIIGFNISGITYNKYIISGSMWIAFLGIITSIAIFWAGSSLLVSTENSSKIILSKLLRKGLREV